MSTYYHIRYGLVGSPLETEKIEKGLYVGGSIQDACIGYFAANQQFILKRIAPQKEELILSQLMVYELTYHHGAVTDHSNGQFFRGNLFVWPLLISVPEEQKYRILTPDDICHCSISHGIDLDRSIQEKRYIRETEMRPWEKKIWKEYQEKKIIINM